MIDRTKVTSGFDLEVLLSEDYLSAVLQGLHDAGTISREFGYSDAAGTRHTLSLAGKRIDRDYPVHPDTADLDTHPAAFKVRILPPGSLADLEVTLVLTGSDAPLAGVLLPATAFFDVSLRWEEGDGDEWGHRVELTFVGLGDETRTLLASNGQDVDEVEARVREKVPTTVPLPLGDKIGKLRLGFLHSGPSPVLAAYANLRMKESVTSYAPTDHGDESMARDFRTDADQPLAIASSPEFYERLGTHIFHLMAKQDGVTGEWVHGVSRADDEGALETEFIATKVRVASDEGRLLVEVEGEYVLSVLPDPDLTIQVWVDLEKSATGNSEVRVETDVEMSVETIVLLGLLGISLLALLFPPSMMLGSVVPLAADAILDEVVDDKLQEQDAVTRIKDAAPVAVTVATKRWDPFYATRIRVQAQFEDSTITDGVGLAMAASSVRLVRGFVPDPDVVIRDDVSSAMKELEELVYDVGADASALRPSPTPRAMPESLGDWRVIDPAQPSLVAIAPEAITERLDGDGKRILGRIPYHAIMRSMDKTRIGQLLLLSHRERALISNSHLGEYQDEARADIERNQGAALREEAANAFSAEHGRPPGPLELQERYAALLESAVVARAELFKLNELPALVTADSQRMARFDLPPSVLIALLGAGVIDLPALQVVGPYALTDNTIVMPYLRDRADKDKTNNLSSLPTYTWPYVPPA